MKIPNSIFRSAMLIILASTVSNAFAQSPEPPKSTSKINVKYDKGKDLTTVSLKSTTITRPNQEKTTASNLPLHQMDLEGSFVHVGQFPTTPAKDIQLRFHAVAQTYIFLKPQEVIVAIDREVPNKDRGFSLGMTGYKSLPPKYNTVYEEFFEITIPTDALRKIAAAESVEFFFGPVTYKLTEKQMFSMKEWSKFLPAESN